MYDKRAKQDALDLWFSMPGEMSVDDFAAELGYPSGSTLRNWIKADPRHDPDKCQYRSKPVLPKLEAIRRVAEGATAAQAARETGLTPQQVRYSVGRYARGGTAALLPAPARKRRKGEAVDEGKTRRASRPARPMPCEQPPGLPEELPDDPAALKAIIADLELSNAALREVLAVLKAGAPALTNAEAAGCASRLEGAFGAAAACAALGLARSTYYYQLDALTSPSAPPDGTAGEVERAFRVDGNSSRGYRFVREVVSRRRGRPVSEKVVRRLMRGLGLRVCYARRGRYSSYAGEIDAPAPNLLLRADGTHDFSAGRPNEAWVSDVTEFRLPDDGRKVYLSPVVDLFDGKLLALPQNQPNAPLYPAGGAPGSRPGALPHFGRPRYLGPPPRARSTAGSSKSAAQISTSSAGEPSASPGATAQLVTSHPPSCGNLTVTATSSAPNAASHPAASAALTTAPSRAARRRRPPRPAGPSCGRTAPLS